MTWEIEMSTGWTNDWMLTIADWFCTQRTGDDVEGGVTGVELLKLWREAEGEGVGGQKGPEIS